MENHASLTALLSAFGRAYHAEQAVCPVFADTRVKELLTGEEYRKIAGYILSGLAFFAPGKMGSFSSDQEALRYLVNTQIAPVPLARARFCEDSLQNAVQTGTEQLVILGAGLDTFAFREPAFVSRYMVYEVDHPLTQADKLQRIRRAGWQIPENLRFVPMDFSREDLKEKLLQAGFNPGQKAFFSWLGVSMYLYKDEMEKLLQSVASLAADGSELLFDYADSGLFLSEVERVQNMVAMAKAGGEEMKSSFDALYLETMLSEQGFLAYEHLDRAAMQRRYFDGRTDGLSAFEHIGYVRAVLKKSLLQPEKMKEQK